MTNRELGIGLKFNNLMSSLPESELPPVYKPNPRNWYAILSTNETMGARLTIPNEANFYDGYIIGVGFGSIFRLLSLLKSPNNLPKAIIIADVMPEVVLAGRIGLKKIQDVKDLNGFINSLRTTNSTDIEKVIGEENNPAVSERLEYAGGYVQSLFRTSRFPIGQGYFLNPNMMQILDRHFRRIRQLAQEQNISVVLSSIVNPRFLDNIIHLDDYRASAHIVYVSNIIDHITERGWNFKNIDALKPLAKLQTEKGSILVDTTEQRLNYALRITTLPPTYSEEDFPWLYWRKL